MNIFLDKLKISTLEEENASLKKEIDRIEKRAESDFKKVYDFFNETLDKYYHEITIKEDLLKEEKYKNKELNKSYKDLWNQNIKDVKEYEARIIFLEDEIRKGQ